MPKHIPRKHLERLVRQEPNGGLACYIPLKRETPIKEGDKREGLANLVMTGGFAWWGLGHLWGDTDGPVCLALYSVTGSSKSPNDMVDVAFRVCEVIFESVDYRAVQQLAERG